MSQQDNFAGGFVVGALLGGVLGGILGATLAGRTRRGPAAEKSLEPRSAKAQIRSRRNGRVVGDATEVQIEEARQTLEQKIAQLNDAIDTVRQQLGEIKPAVKPAIGDRE
jgi:hypothetical protein